MITSLEVCQLAGLTPRQLDHWTTTGKIAPIGDSLPGSGNPRQWDPSEVAVIVDMARLVRAGLTVEAAARAARDGGHLAEGVVVTIDNTSDRGSRYGDDRHRPIGRHRRTGLRLAAV